MHNEQVPRMTDNASSNCYLFAIDARHKLHGATRSGTPSSSACHDKDHAPRRSKLCMWLIAVVLRMHPQVVMGSDVAGTHL